MLSVAKRLGIGLISMIAILVVFDLIPSPFSAPIPPDQFIFFSPLNVAWSALGVAVAAFAGAYIARVPFATAAVLVTAAAWLIALEILQQIAETIQPVAFTELLARNSVSIGILIVGAAIGAEVGLRLATRNNTT